MALGFSNSCVFDPFTLDCGEHGGGVTPNFSDASVAASSPLKTPSRSGSRSSKNTCAICLCIMKAGKGQALFTAECSHTFHFQCISSNVKYGNKVCPICRAKWNEMPIQVSLTPPINPINWTQDEGYMNLLRRVPRNNSSNMYQEAEPAKYDDDEPVDFHYDYTKETIFQCITTLDIKTFPEYSSIPKSSSNDNFTVLIHLKAPLADTKAMPQSTSSATHQNSRAPIDLVTVLDTSGSMSGTKLALLKRAMGFVIQNLGPSDRLSVIAFSSTAHRLFHLRKMTESGRQYALQAVNSLVSTGGTNIAEGLRKGAKVIEERKCKNPVCSIILLSDGQDTYSVAATSNDYRSILSSSIQHIPVHAFGFGADHDSALMHYISETSGGTFSFIEAEHVIQDAFAQCIGGLLSVVVQELKVGIECIHPGVKLAPIKSGSYASQVSGNIGSIDVGDLYADEEKDFLVSVSVPITFASDTELIKVSCSYRNPVSKESISLEEELKIKRTDYAESMEMSVEVDRERNRVRAAAAMAKSRAFAEQGSLSEAVSILETERKLITESVSGKAGDKLCVALDAEMREMQERMTTKKLYEASGRAYVLSGLSSHSWQRATTRGDSTNSGSLVHAYQTPSMVDMVNKSQIFSPLTWRPRQPIRPTKY